MLNILPYSAQISFFQTLITGLAYLDPGSGSFILQLLIASLLGAAFILKTHWQRLIEILRNKFSERGDDKQE